MRTRQEVEESCVCVKGEAKNKDLKVEERFKEERKKYRENETKVRDSERETKTKRKSGVSRKREVKTN